MTQDVYFEEQEQTIHVDFGQIQDISDGGYDRGYAKGEADGYEKGHTEGLTEGVEQGEKAEYDCFWDAFQQNGERTNYDGAFSCFTDDIYKPKYPLRAIIADRMYKDTAITGRVDVDLSNCNAILNMFTRAQVSEIGVLDWSLVSTANYVIERCPNLTKIEKIIVSRNITLTGGTFSAVPLLTRVIFEGELANAWDARNLNAIDAESVQSIIDCLVDLTGQTSKNLRLHNNIGEKLTQAQKDAISAKNWTLVY